MSFVRLTDFVRLAVSPPFSLGSLVARAPRLRKAEAWVITRVRPSRGGGNPIVYGVPVTSGSAAAAAAAASGGVAVAAAVPAAVETPLSGVLKGDWVIVSDAGKRRARCADVVRTSDGLRLGDALTAAAVSGGEPFADGHAEVLATAAAVHAVQKAAAGKLAAAAAAAAAGNAAAAAAAK
jgi:hypothetical protein